MNARLRAFLRRQREAGLYRSRRVVDSPQGREITIDGRRLLNFCSNDYLGLAADPRLAAAARGALDTWGTGAGAAHLVNGHFRPHHELEEALAAFTGRQRALLFSTGYMANLAVIAALAERGSPVLEDRLNHASLLDGGLLAGARLRRYPHADPAGLERLLERADGPALVATDGVFSMDGDLAPLPELAEVCARHDAVLVADDAHGIGVLGAGGAGSLAHFGLDAQRVPVLVGTLGKALGTAGAFVAGDADLVEYLVQRARPYIYTTAQPPAIAAATLESLAIAREEDWRREHLDGLVARFRRGLASLGWPLPASGSPIQPLRVGGSGAAVTLSRELERRGCLVTAIRPPTVPRGTARLRVTLTAAHRETDVDVLLETLASVGPVAEN